jgi:hypothetical protein
MRISSSKHYPLFIAFRFWKWAIEFHIATKELRDHHCLNQVMDGDYECEYCNPRSNQTSSFGREDKA